MNEILQSTLQNRATRKKDNLQKKESVNKWCTHMYYKYKVLPGQSWGTLNDVQIDRWMKLRCDRLYCKPHKKEGKGKYKCIPLSVVPSDVEIRERNETAATIEYNDVAMNDKDPV